MNDTAGFHRCDGRLAACAGNAKHFPSSHHQQSAIAAAWTCLCLICWFLYTKIELNEAGTGWILIPSLVILFLYVVGCRLASGERVVFQGTALAALAFCAFLVFRLVLGATTLWDVFGYTVSYSEGVIFGLCLGMMTSVLIDTIFSGPSNPRVAVAGVCFVVGNVGYVLLSTYQFSQHSSVTGRSFMLVNETYQTSERLTDALALLVAIVMVRSQRHLKSRNWWTREFAMCCLCTAYLGVAAVFTQLLGSNAGPAFLIPLGIWSASCLLTDAQSARNSIGSRVPRRSTETVHNALWRRSRTAAILALLSVVVGCVLIQTNIIDTSKYRAFEFGESTLFNNNSVMSRIDIVREELLDQVTQSPILGRLGVDSATTGGANHVHSLLSVATHLGVIGALLFLALLIASFRMLMLRRKPMEAGSWDGGSVVFCLGALIWLIVYATLVTFFTWMPLWYGIGVIASPIALNCATHRTDVPR